MGPRSALRLTGIALHLAAGYALCALVYPLIPLRARAVLRRGWARGVLWLLGVRLQVHAPSIGPGSLVVANHVSWLDAVVLQSLLDAASVAKTETRRWPLLGLMLARNDTIFIDRRIGRGLLRVNANIAERLAAAGVVIVFPEGTTTDGSDVRVFRPALFQPAVSGGHPVHALALRYLDESGQRCDAAAFVDDMSLWDSLRAVTALPRLRAEVSACGTFCGRGLQRRDAARMARAAILDRILGAPGYEANEAAAQVAPRPPALAQVIER